MPGIDYRQARADVRLAEVLELLDFEPTAGGHGQVRGRCPVHRCGAGGNALDLWSKVTRQPLHAAVIDLYTRLGREVPWVPWRAARRQPAESVTCQQEKPMPEP
jgi:hypothetical protein